MSKRPAFWILFILVSGLAGTLAVANFPRAFPIVSLDLRMDRSAALRKARTLAAQNHWGPAGAFMQAASFAVDDTVKTFVELDGGGTEALRRMLDRNLYAAYTWRVRDFKPGETNETLVRFTPAGKPYGFVEKLRENEPGPSLSEADARRIAQLQATRIWHVDLAAFVPVEASKETKPGGRTDHTFVYERPSERLGEGRYRLRLVVSGDRLTELTHFLKVPETFARRFAEMRSANNAIAFGAQAAALVLYLIGGGAFGVFILLRQRWVLWRQPLMWGALVALTQALDVFNSWPLAWMNYDTALPRNTFLIQRLSEVVGTFLISVIYLTLTFMAAESLTRRAFPHHPQLWRIWSREAAGTLQVLGRTVGGYLYTGIEFAYIVGFYLIASRLFHWWTPSDSLVQPDILATHWPWFSAVAPSLHAGVWEETLFRAVPIAGAALIGQRLGHRRAWIGAALVLQAVIFGGGHANYASVPSYSRLVELILPAFIWGVIYLQFGLLPTIITHYIFDLSLFAIPLFTSSSSGARIDQTMLVLCGLIPLGIVLVARLRAPATRTLGEALFNGAWKAAPASSSAPVAVPQALPAPRGVWISAARVRVAVALGIAGLAVWMFTGPRPDAPRFRIGRMEARERALKTLAERGFTPSDRWETLTSIEAANGLHNLFVWRTAGPDVYRSLLGTYVQPPHWKVREATFVGDVVERAEEWEVEITGEGTIMRVHHSLPQRRPGASIEESEAREIAHRAIRSQFQIDPASLKEISAVSSKLPARRDWTLTFSDTTSHALKRGELRLAIEIAGNQVTDARRFVFVPEDWERSFRSEESLLGIFSSGQGVLDALVIIAAAVFAIVLWSRRNFPAKSASVIFGVLAVVSMIQIVNSWPAFEAHFKTDEPLPLQRTVAILAGVLGRLIQAAMFALCAGLALGRTRAAAPARSGAPVVLGVALGLVVAGVIRLMWLMSRSGAPAWPEYAGAQSLLPILREALSPVSTVVLRSAVLLVVLAAVHQLSEGWTRRRVQCAALLCVFGAIGGQLGGGATTGLWLVQALVSGVLFLAAYVLVFRHDPAQAPVAIGTIAALGMMRTVLLDAYPGAASGGLLGILVAVAVTALWLRELRRKPASDVPQALATSGLSLQ